MGIIYKANNILNGKTYIGLTTKTLDKRKKQHYQSAKRLKYIFYKALNKYKQEDWEWSILYDDVPDNQLNNMEKWCIANYGTYIYGYNATEGGEGTIGKHHSEETKKKIGKKSKGNTYWLGKKHSATTKIKISQAKKGKSLSEEHKHKISVGLKGKQLGKIVSEETRHKLSVAAMGNKYCLGRIISKETRKKISAANKGKRRIGKHHSEATKKKISLAMKKNG